MSLVRTSLSNSIKSAQRITFEAHFDPELYAQLTEANRKAFVQALAEIYGVVWLGLELAPVTGTAIEAYYLVQAIGSGDVYAIVAGVGMVAVTAVGGKLIAKVGQKSVELGGDALDAAYKKVKATNNALPTPRTVGNLQGGPLENATQVSGRFNFESGPPNGTVFRADNQGNITSYATYDANGQILTRVDVTGAAHNGIPTPHTVVYGRNTLPDGTVRVNRSQAETRPANPDEIP